MWLQLIQAINPFGIVSGWLDNKKHEQAVKSAIKQKQLENVRQGKLAEAEWNLTALKKSGWRGHWFAFIFSIPLVGAFIPAAVPHIEQGFIELSKMPIWYQTAVSVIIAASFGFQKFAENRFDKAYTLPSKE